MKLLFALLTFLCMNAVAHAQQNYLSGSIIDQSNHDPVPQASLNVNHKQIGTVSNAEGKFMLLLADLSETDSITISCVGYKTAVAQILQLKKDKNSIIYLEPLVFNLNEVVVQPMSVAEILKEAIETTNALIPVESNLNAYYKEFAYLDNKLFKYADAAMYYIVDNSNKKTKVEMHIIESRVKKDSLTAENKWKSNVESLIKPDKPVKDYYSLKYLNRLIEPKQIAKYEYKMQTRQGVTKISIDPKEAVHEFLPDVTVYINIDNHQIIKVTSDYHTHITYAPSANLLILALSFEKYSMSAIYSDGAHPFLRYCKIEQDIRFRVGGKKGVLGSIAEVVVHDTNAKMPDLDGMGSAVFNKRNIYENGSNFSPDFWFKYNTLLPTAEEMKALQ